MLGGAQRVALLTVGCKLNQADSESLRAALERAGHTVLTDEAAADVCIVNSCTVTAEADRDSRRLLRRLRRAHPSALVVAVGCYAETDAATLEGLEEVDWALARVELADLPQALLEGRRPSATPTPPGLLPARPAHTAHARARLVLQDGCDRFCAYCKVPLARGRERSLPRDDALSALRALEGGGFAEVVLVGCNLGGWGRTLPGAPTLAALLREALTLDLPRLRLGSIEPDWLTDELCEVVASSGGRICPHLHIPLQSGSPAVLGAMGRGEAIEPLLERIADLRGRVGLLAVGLDLLVGFPTESEADFAATVEVVRRLEPSRLHVFPYSPRPGTAAVALGDPIARPEKKRRVHTLLDLGAELEARFLAAHVGRQVAFVVEGDQREGLIHGTTETYLRAETPWAGPGAPPLVRGVVTDVREGTLLVAARA